jgi:hypothetical protein
MSRHTGFAQWRIQWGIHCAEQSRAFPKGRLNVRRVTEGRHGAYKLKEFLYMRRSTCCTASYLGLLPQKASHGSGKALTAGINRSRPEDPDAQTDGAEPVFESWVVT